MVACGVSGVWLHPLNRQLLRFCHASSIGSLFPGPGWVHVPRGVTIVCTHSPWTSELLPIWLLWILLLWPFAHKSLCGHVSFFLLLLFFFFFFFFFEKPESKIAGTVSVVYLYKKLPGVPWWPSSWGLGIVTAVAQVAAMAWVWSLAREFPCSVDTAKKKRDKKKKERKKLTNSPPKAVPFYIPTSSMWRAPYLPLTWLLIFWILAMPVGVKWYLTVALIYISLMTDDAASFHVLIFHLWMPAQTFCPCFYWVVCLITEL